MDPEQNVRYYFAILDTAQVKVVYNRAILIAVTSEYCVKWVNCKTWIGLSAWSLANSDGLSGSDFFQEV